MKFKPELIEIIKNGTSAQRLYIFEQNLYLFGYYYFTEFFSFQSADFHFDFSDDFIKLENSKLEEVAWIAFAESAKTSWAKIGVIHAIAYKKKEYINWDSYDRSNSENALFDIANFLRTNKKLIADFGRLYSKKANKKLIGQEEEEDKMKRMGNFITNNGVKVEAFSTQESTRGRVFKHIRPDMYIFDDFENNRTKDSYPVTKKIIEHIDEAKRGLGPGGSILYLCNYISEEGSVAHVANNLKGNPKTVVRFIPVISPQGVIAWPQKYVKTDKEAAEINSQITDPKTFKISLESKERSLTTKVYETEMKLNPSGSGDYFFDRAFVRQKMALARNPLKTIGHLKIWSEHNSKYAFGSGVDTAEGKGLDSSSQVIINFTRKPALVCATYERNDIIPTLFGHDVKRNCELYGECIVCPEVNGIGYSTLSTLMELEYPNIYQREVKNKKTGKLQNEYGIRSAINGFGVRWDLFSQFKESFESGELEIWDKDLLTEMYHFKKQDIEIRKMEPGMTRHFDKLTAAVITWEMRKHALPPMAQRKEIFYSKQAPFVR